MQMDHTTFLRSFATLRMTEGSMVAAIQAPCRETLLAQEEQQAEVTEFQA